MEPIAISALNHFDYCPRRYYLMFIDNVFTENPYTVEGEILHQKVHERGTSRRGDFVQIRRVLVYSRRLNIIGVADLLEEKAGEIYPVEYKRGRQGNWKNDQLQLCAQALCLEEMLSRSIPYGYIYYASSSRRKKIDFSPSIRESTERTIARVRMLRDSLQRPPAVLTRRCHGCSLYPVCLPEETIKLKSFLSRFDRL